MALHSGPAEYRDGDYFGPTLNRVARLLALGHGGQTLLSAITHELCRDYLPPNVSLKSLGEHSLKDLDRREAVFEVRHTESLQNFPPLRTLLAPIDSDTPSIAVLPFADLSPKRDQEYFTDGLAEELLNVLTKIRGLRVASRTSAFSFKGKDLDIPTMAQKLNVATILEGSVRKSGNRVRITAQLIQVATDSHLWSETYDRDLEDIFAVQDDIAQSVVKGLRAALLGEKPDASANAVAKSDVQAAAKGRGENAEAYRLYLQGRFFGDRFTLEDNAKAIEHYRQALGIDPSYALAWAGLSLAYQQQVGYWKDTTIVEEFSKAREAAERALQLEPDLAEGHLALGHVRMNDWDWNGADASFRRAFELAPGSAQVLSGTAVLGGSLGRLDEAVALLRRAVMLDPLNAEAYQFLEAWCIRAGLLDEAEVAATNALELDPRRGVTLFWLGIVQMAQGRLEDALETFKRETLVTFRLLGLALVYHASGRSAQSDAVLREMIEKEADASAYQIALAYAYRGEADLAFVWLERAYVQRDTGLGGMKVSTLLENLHGDPRWLPFLRKMGLADSAYPT